MTHRLRFRSNEWKGPADSPSSSHPALLRPPPAFPVGGRAAAEEGGAAAGVGLCGCPVLPAAGGLAGRERQEVQRLQPVGFLSCVALKEEGGRCSLHLHERRGGRRHTGGRKGRREKETGEGERRREEERGRTEEGGRQRGGGKRREEEVR